MRKISKAEWRRTHSNYKGVTNGKRHILMFVKGKGTSLVEVEVTGMRAPRKRRRK